jgi:hypothetical protein
MAAAQIVWRVSRFLRSRRPSSSTTLRSLVLQGCKFTVRAGSLWWGDLLAPRILGGDVMAPVTHDPAAGTDHHRARGWPLAGLVLMLVLGAFPALSSVLDLLADSRTGLPSDHAGTFTAVAGTQWAQAQAGMPGTARYITLLERGYALHELTFALLFLLIVAIPFRRRQRWAWWRHGSRSSPTLATPSPSAHMTTRS